MSVDFAVAGKALAAACAELREGEAADALGAGVVPAFVALPGSTGEAAAVLRVAAEHELAVVPRGGGSRLGWGAPPSRCDVLVDMSSMDAVLEHAAGDLVARLQAGARMGDVADLLATAGQEIALDVPAGATAGGVVASALTGPRRLRYGSPRDLLIGITIVLANGTVARSGGKVVKNVAGYDLGKLFAGSAGTLGLITEVTFRLHPLPAARAFVAAEFGASAVAAACDAVATAANSSLIASAVELSRPSASGPLLVSVLLEGSADGVAGRAAAMDDLLGRAGASRAKVSGTAPPWWPGPPAAEAGETLVRVSFWVSALGQVLDAIDAAARGAGIAPPVAGSAGAGVLYISCPPGEPEACAGFVGALRGTLDHARGGVAVLAAPAEVRAALASRGGMAGSVPGLSLMRSVKDQFDPGHRMSPGRFPEVI